MYCATCIASSIQIAVSSKKLPREGRYINKGFVYVLFAKESIEKNTLETL